MRNLIQIQYYDSPYGNLIIGSYGDRLCLCDWTFRKRREPIDNRIQTGLKACYKEQSSDVIQKAVFQLEEYFNKKRMIFDIPLLFVGTDFQKKVWEMLLEIPYGTTETYGGLSGRMHNPKAVRAVAAANGANAISIFVPCHRIIGSNKQLTGYAGGLSAKKKLLGLEFSSNNPYLDLF
ncbi:methylated-DNA--protein-cysteine methyltransferase [Bacteroidia bacterium]|nr:methylated-DNA--protein-cysteine methyltransferase [Bacteroidia bacterium]